MSRQENRSEEIYHLTCEFSGRGDWFEPAALCSVTLAEVLRRLLDDSAGIGLTKHALLDRLGGIHDGWVIVDGKPRRAVEDLEPRERKLWDAVVALPGETLGIDSELRA